MGHIEIHSGRNLNIWWHRKYSFTCGTIWPVLFCTCLRLPGGRNTTERFSAIFDQNMSLWAKNTLSKFWKLFSNIYIYNNYITLYTYIYIHPIYLWEINSGKAPYEKVSFLKNGSNYQTSWSTLLCFEQGGVKPFCLKHFPQSCHMKSIFAKRHFQQEIDNF